MGNGMPNETRSYECITTQDLNKLKIIALDDFKELLNRNPQLRLLQKLKLGIAFCQGAALHYATQKLGRVYATVEKQVERRCGKKLGIKDLDVFMFFRKGAKSYPPRRRGIADSGKFGQNPDEKSLKAKSFTGRRVDIMGRSIECHDNESFTDALIRYLQEGKTPTAQYLSQKAVVVLEPEPCGKIVWMLGRKHNEKPKGEQAARRKQRNSQVNL